MSKIDIDAFEQKKVQEVKGSFYIYLPKDWCKKYNVGDARKVFLKQLEDDSLLVRFNSVASHNDRSYIINLDTEDVKEKNLDKEEYMDYLFNTFLAAYLIGYKRVIFKKRTKIPMQIQNKITSMTRTLHGMVIISESPTEVVVEDASSSIDIKLLMRQMLSKVGLYLANLIEVIENDQIGQAAELMQQDHQIDEHRYAIEREVHEILLYPSLAFDAGITTVECLHYSECCRLTERIGDYITKVAGLLQVEKIHNKKEILDHLHNAEGIFNTLQDYYERNDSYKYFHLIREVKKFAEVSQKVVEEGHPDKNFLISIRRIKNICADIAEIRINDILSRLQQKVE